MDPAPELLDSLVAAFATTAASMDPDAYWTALHCFVMDRFAAQVLEGDNHHDWVRRATWVTYATAIWCTRSWRVSWMSPGDTFGITTTEETVAPLLAELTASVSALAAGPEAVTQRLGQTLRLPTFHGSVFGLAYNSAYLIVVGEKPPVGRRPDHLRFDDGFMTANADRLMALSYQAELPQWLVRLRQRYDDVQTNGPERFGTVIEGPPDAPDLSELWQEGYRQGIQNWSENATLMTQDYYEPFVRWSLVYNYGVEAFARAAIIALAGDDPDLARQALIGNLLFTASWGAFPLGVVDETISLPRVQQSS
jgi:hypothetical protein